MDVGRASRLGMKRKVRSNRGRDRKVFSRTAGRTRSENVRRNPMRGGIRL